jgi:hypothetical protein
MYSTTKTLRMLSRDVRKHHHKRHSSNLDIRMCMYCMCRRKHCECCRETYGNNITSDTQNQKKNQWACRNQTLAVTDKLERYVFVQSVIKLKSVNKTLLDLQRNEVLAAAGRLMKGRQRRSRRAGNRDLQNTAGSAAQRSIGSSWQADERKAEKIASRGQQGLQSERCM